VAAFSEECCDAVVESVCVVRDLIKQGQDLVKAALSA
jgi:hypothetical protein